ncbi:MAG: DNA translocase FtsK 4TM domain-containing protein [Elusimicrobia bacterium]|nr:DNA translocase FtsK 4TM domain-containing protein [Elusimicrobiota bacterium]
MREPSHRYYARASRISKSRRARWNLASAVGSAVLALYLCWLVLVPALSGSAGQWANEHLRGLFGNAVFLIPVIIACGLYRFFKEGRAAGIVVMGVAALVSLASAAGVLAVSAHPFGASPSAAGGVLGSGLGDGLANALGGFGAFIVCAALLLFTLQAVLGLRLSAAAAWLTAVVADDLQRWRRARQELAGRVERAPKGDAAIKDAAPAPPPQTASPVEPVNVVEERAAAKARPAKGAEKPRRPATAGRYQVPPLDLLRPRPAAANTGKPLESEIKSAILALEQTFKDFKIEARVTGYAPGPVITRYEVTPAPGVKVSAFVTLQKDIARALKAKGIRIIAPIPGKDAVGIEIPNARPALVVLREVLESPALPPDASLLTFAVGLSASGEAMSADLQKMPHLLVAGATNSGKSVFVHSLILSILYRARPDEVKFLLIDPKRLELTFYEGIPHLFDPIVPADKVTVVTSPKEAANSLSNLVKIMESRYARFQLYGVRNIDGYNKEADKRGEPREYFIVVVIDELADLMLVAGGKVEDNIQRLAQMARAVGIHMVLATQRPSVDIITGVIKANLPCRVAMQVISQVDSKVILDIMGAETLQGRGDMLYRSAGSQSPERCQGAYVTEEEINQVVAHLRGQGKPDYPELETMPKPGEADLASFGVTALEFSQALKLVLERRRVSQDLLKSQFGSSARATNILSLLEVKGLIHKPDGSNRWEIHFDEIEACLRADFPQVPINEGKR